MSEIKAGDRVNFIISNIGETGDNFQSFIDKKPHTVFVVDRVCGRSLYLKEHKDYSPSGSWTASFFELAWKPQEGELIEVCGNENKWKPRVFSGMFKGFYMCEPAHGKNIPRTWELARPIKKTHTITDENGRTAEISAESYTEMAKLFKEA